MRSCRGALARFCELLDGMFQVLVQEGVSDPEALRTGRSCDSLAGACSRKMVSHRPWKSECLQVWVPLARGGDHHGASLEGEESRLQDFDSRERCIISCESVGSL